jgi:hypothetical protein
MWFRTWDDSCICLRVYHNPLTRPPFAWYHICNKIIAYAYCICNVKLTEVPLPSLEEIDRLDLRKKAINSVRIIDNKAECQLCHVTVEKRFKMTRSAQHARITVINNRIRWLQEHRYLQNVDHVVKNLEAEKETLIKHDSEYEPFRELPLHLIRYRRGYKMICGECMNKRL